MTLKDLDLLLAQLFPPTAPPDYDYHMEWKESFSSDRGYFGRCSLRLHWLPLVSQKTPPDLNVMDDSIEKAAARLRTTAACYAACGGEGIQPC